MRCDSCQLVRINGAVCHETGCPEAWKRVRSCRECGQRFVPDERGQTCCDEECHAAYHGLPSPSYGIGGE